MYVLRFCKCMSSCVTVLSVCCRYAWWYVNHAIGGVYVHTCYFQSYFHYASVLIASLLCIGEDLVLYVAYPILVDSQ